MKRVRDQLRSFDVRVQRPRLTKRRGLLARMMQLPQELIDTIQQQVIKMQISLAPVITRRRLANNPSRYWGYSSARQMFNYTLPMDDPAFDWEGDNVRYYGWGAQGNIRGWEENIRRHLYARNIERL